MRRRRDRKPFTLEEARRRLSDLLWQIDHLVHERDDVDLAELCRAAHAFAQGASVLKGLQETDALEEVAELKATLGGFKERLDAVEAEPSRLRA